MAVTGFPVFATLLALATLSAPFVSSTVYAAPVSLLQTRVRKDKGPTAQDAQVNSHAAAPQAGPSEIASTLQTLDANHDKRVDPSEVLAFASALGIDAKSITREFSGLDANSDGTLDENEIAQALRTPDSAAGTQQSSAHTNRKAEDDNTAQKPEEQAAPQIAEEHVALRFVDEDEAIQARSISSQSPVNAAASAPQHEQQQAQYHDQKYALPSKDEQTVLAGTLSRGLPNHAQAPLAQVEAKTVDSSLRQNMTSGDAAFMATASQEDVAQNAATLVATQLELEAAQNAEARHLDQEAAQLRARATAVARTALKEAIEAGERAAMAESEKMVHLLESLELGAMKAESQAASLHAKAAAELKQANDYSSIASIALGDYSSKAVTSPDGSSSIVNAHALGAVTAKS